MPEKKQYLKIIGKLFPDNTLKLMPCYIIDETRDFKENRNGEILLEFYNDNGNLLSKEWISALPYITENGESKNLAIRGRVPFPSETALIWFFYKEKKIHEIKVGKAKPSITIKTEGLKGRKMLGKKLIFWEGGHPEHKQLQYFLQYSHDNGKIWYRINKRTYDTSQEVNFDELPGGAKCRIAVIATDGINTTRSESPAFSVPVKPCKSMIFSPEDGAEFRPDQEVFFRGQGFYLEERTPETNDLVWTSSIDGELGRGMSLLLKNISTGVHKITLTAGKGKRAGKAQITVKIAKVNKG